jgi:hypothetical protein
MGSLVHINYLNLFSVQKILVFLFHLIIHIRINQIFIYYSFTILVFLNLFINFIAILNFILIHIFIHFFENLITFNNNVIIA